MRYFLVFETDAKREARLFFASSVSAFVLKQVFDLFVPFLSHLTFLLDLLGCALLFCGALLWDRTRLRRVAIFSVVAFVLRLALVLWNPRGLFSFFTLLPFSFLVLLCEIWVAETYGAFLAFCARQGQADTLMRAKNALLRSELTFWVATLISYLSGVLAFSALLLYFWALGVRAWLSYLLFRNPQFISSRSFFERRRVHAH